MAEHLGPSFCEDGKRHYEVISPEMVAYYSMEPPEPFRCWGIYLAANAAQAKVEAVKDKEFYEWVRDARGDGVPPFKGLTAKRTLCEHGHCWGCDECPTCAAEDYQEWLKEVAAHAG